ncbi:MAG: phosphoenolpyruvate carboxykinase (ATP) [Bacteroidales bacterium]|nr:phosphoenolpyruvate carboxykinase (ATP) [Bacteroidales bacterium]
MKDLKAAVTDVLGHHPGVLKNISRTEMIRLSVERHEAMVTESGALATWTAPESTGRSPKDTLIVKRSSSEGNIDWTSANNLPIDADTFDSILEDAIGQLKVADKLYETDRTIGADSKYALPVKVVTNRALHTLFIDNMFRPVPADIEKSCFAKDGFLLIALPYYKLDSAKYEGKLRKLPNGKTSDLVVAMDFDRGIGMVIGSAYMGSMKKMLFTVMNYLLPLRGILPLHCSANEGTKKDSALLLGLSGTGKTTLSADPARALLGDDEHGWSDDGIANFENGCYAKMIDINPKKEPDIYDAVMHKADYLKHGSMVENAMVYPDGRFDFDDNRFTENSRASFPLSFLKNIKPSSVAGHPKTILFLTADAYGVLPPVSKLNKEQAMLWFMMGYTSKLAGTETGVTEPQVAFSRFFGAPFMPCKPDKYATMLGEKMEKFQTNVFLVNTGWSGGSYGIGKRIDLTLTRRMVNAALSGELDGVDYTDDKLFHLQIPVSCPGVPSEILNPINTWADPEAYRAAANKLAKQFSDHFDKAYGSNNLPASMVSQCPGK